MGDAELPCWHVHGRRHPGGTLGHASGPGGRALRERGGRQVTMRRGQKQEARKQGHAESSISHRWERLGWGHATLKPDGREERQARAPLAAQASKGQASVAWAYHVNQGPQ